MDQKLSTRFWIEFALGVLSAACLALTLVWPQWIETIFGLHPDAGDGSSEWGITLGLIAGTICLFVLARREWRSVYVK